MAVKWMKLSKGIRYYEHPINKHGVNKDRYFSIRFTVDGRQIEEGIGWDSELADAKKRALAEAGADTEKKAKAKAKSSNAEEEANRRITELRENRRQGEGPRTLTEKRALENAVRQEKAEQEEQEVKDRLTFKELVEGSLKNPLETDKHGRKKKSTETEQGYLKNWIYPVIGTLPLKEVAPIHIEKVKAGMVKAKKAPRSAHYALAIVRHIFNLAIFHDLFDGPNPVNKVKLPGGDNRRLRFLTRDEAGALLAELAVKSPDVHDMALVSLHTGMRAGEVFGLTWADVDVDRGILILRDTKNTKTRAAYMTEAVKDVFRGRERGGPSELVFPDRNGKRIKRISHTFAKAVDTLKLNEGIVDRRYHVTFHSLRHTYASWHVENGTDLYAVKELLGHSDFKMTARYSHLGENTLQVAVKRLDATLQTPGKVVDIAKGAK